MKSSLTSITFRKKTIEEIIALVRTTELNAIEWGGDVHVAPGDKEAAKKALRLTRESGLEISAYGSYYRCKPEEDFTPVLESALRLETPIIRVWAGAGFAFSKDCPADDRLRFTEKLADNVRQAKEAGCIVATEYHGNTLTDTLASTQQLLKDIPDLYTYWQPRTRPPLPVAENISDVKALGKRVVNVHVFYWDEECVRHPIKDNADNLLQYLRAADQYTDARYAAIEFVKDESDAQLIEDAATLQELLRKI